MDLLELRILAVGGILAVGIVVSTVAVAVVTASAWIARVWDARGHVGSRAAGQGPDLGAGRARC